MNYKIAIDGPSGTGKSTTAKLLAKKLNFIYVDTGAMYRAVGLYCYRNNIDPLKEEDVINILDNIDINIFYKDGIQEVELNGEIVSKEIREPYISKYTPYISQYKKVREKLTVIQQDLANKNSVIMDGRDIGTVVLPNAELKIFLTASDEVRAQRRYKELISKGEDTQFDKVLKDLKERDYKDITRINSPLKQAEDAILIDSSNLTIEEVVNKIYDMFNKKVGR